MRLALLLREFEQVQRPLDIDVMRGDRREFRPRGEKRRKVEHAVHALHRRVEAMVPVLDRSLQDRLAQILDVELEDDVLAWSLQPSGSWSKVPTIKGVNAQQAFEQLAAARAAATNGNNGHTPDA